jgi:hypothetical protein
MAAVGKISSEDVQKFYETSRQAGLTPGWMGPPREAQPAVEPFL